MRMVAAIGRGAQIGVYGVPAALGAAGACFLIWLAGIHYNLNAPTAPEAKKDK